MKINYNVINQLKENKVAWKFLPEEFREVLRKSVSRGMVQYLDNVGSWYTKPTQESHFCIGVTFRINPMWFPRVDENGLVDLEVGKWEKINLPLIERLKTNERMFVFLNKEEQNLLEDMFYLGELEEFSRYDLQWRNKNTNILLAPAQTYRIKSTYDYLKTCDR
jgi:hypothetical protein